MGRNSHEQVEAMDGTSRQRLRVWEDATMTILHDRAESPEGWPTGPHHPSAFAERLYAAETLDATQSPPADEAAEPYTLQWFLDIENQRHGRQGRWIPRLMEFAKHSSETLLGLGNGLGTDWLQYARHGAHVVVCSPSGAQLSLIRRNFELRGLAGRFLHAAPTSLPLETASIDVACISSLLHEVPDPQAVIHEVYRVLKPGGKVLAVTPALYDVDYWNDVLFPWRSQRRGKPDTPLRFTARSLKRLFASFSEHRIHKRHLRRSEVPHLWRWLPTQVLERLIGHVLILKAFKPLSAAISLAQAA
ncbi:MAG: class I SAM-dependent methyltransferase [Gemmataceae bacterium]